jgi:hypothetical protein
MAKKELADLTEYEPLRVAACEAYTLGQDIRNFREDETDWISYLGNALRARHLQEAKIGPLKVEILRERAVFCSCHFEPYLQCTTVRDTLDGRLDYDALAAEVELALVEHAGAGASSCRAIVLSACAADGKISHERLTAAYTFELERTVVNPVEKLMKPTPVPRGGIVYPAPVVSTCDAHTPAAEKDAA